MGMLVLPFLAIYLTTERHLPSQVVGLIVALPGLGGILASLLMSTLADRLSRKSIFVMSLSLGGPLANHSISPFSSLAGNHGSVLEYRQ